MKMKSILISMAFALSAAATSSQATPVEITYTTSGSSGNWIYDFTVTNNMGNQYLYVLGVSLYDATPTFTPTNFSATTSNYYVNGINYKNRWGSDLFETGVNPSMSVSGFQLTSTALALQSNVNVLAFGYNYGVQYGGNDFQVGSATNPGFTMVATHLAANPVPEPASLLLLAAGVLGLGIARSKAKGTAAA